MRNYCFRSIGSSKRNVVEQYIGRQLGPYSDTAPFNPNALQRFQIFNSSCDLSQPRRTSHSIYWYNLHIVLVNDKRECEIRESRLQTIHDTILKIARVRDYQLSRAAILPDHIHLALGCGSEKSPADVALCFLNNLAFALDREPVFQMGFFAGTFGEYDLGVIYNASKAAQSCGEIAE
ncbi:MAG: transposase [Candidatus Sumerlaeota bacterium]|nr:transposase [Candidatus Sumerlaeota bacterium]